MEPQTTQDELQTKLIEMENNWKRALADYRNLQKRTEEEKESLVTFISSMLLKRLLPVLDNMELLEKHIDDSGLKMITKEFRQILAEEGITELEVHNKDFDAETMEAIEVVQGEENVANATAARSNVRLKVVEVINKGYMFRKVGANAPRLLRPARVKVGKSIAVQDTAKEGSA